MKTTAVITDKQQAAMFYPLVTDTKTSKVDQRGATWTMDGTPWKRPNLKQLTDDQRKALGMVTTRNPNISYHLLPDNTKVCRCCQQRKPADAFSNTQQKYAKDEKRSNCKVCNDRYVKVFMAHRGAEKKAAPTA